jgi:hypothetical protein
VGARSLWLVSTVKRRFCRCGALGDCRRAFHEFDSCFALCCGACPCKFCGWCLADCGDQNAHPHVARCSEKPPNADTYFSSRRDFEDSHTKRCKRKVTEYLASLETETRAAVRGALAKQLRELDMMIMMSVICSLIPLRGALKGSTYAHGTNYKHFIFFLYSK